MLNKYIKCNVYRLAVRYDQIVVVRRQGGKGLICVAGSDVHSWFSHVERIQERHILTDFYQDKYEENGLKKQNLKDVGSAVLRNISEFRTA